MFSPGVFRDYLWILYSNSSGDLFLDFLAEFLFVSSRSFFNDFLSNFSIIVFINIFLHSCMLFYWDSLRDSFWVSAQNGFLFEGSIQGFRPVMLQIFVVCKNSSLVYWALAIARCSDNRFARSKKNAKKTEWKVLTILQEFAGAISTGWTGYGSPKTFECRRVWMPFAQRRHRLTNLVIFVLVDFCYWTMGRENTCVVENKSKQIVNMFWK